MNLSSRLKALERRHGDGCVECRGRRECIVHQPDQPNPPDHKYCPRCGRDVSFIIRIKYDKPEKP